MTIFDGFFKHFFLHERGRSDEQGFFVVGVDCEFSCTDIDKILNVDFVAVKVRGGV